MIAIAVDDEVLMLGALTNAIKASSDITSVADFTSCEDALEYIKSNPADIAFLDINMRGMGGLALAEKIIVSCPECKIVFCTGYEEYAIPAFKLHASGYLMKPVSAKDVQVEIDNIKGIRQREKPLKVKCFGNFEVYAKGEKLTFLKPKNCSPFWWIEMGLELLFRKLVLHYGKMMPIKRTIIIFTNCSVICANLLKWWALKTFLREKIIFTL